MGDGSGRPSATALVALGVDDWSALLAVALPVVRRLPELHVDAVVKRVAALPPGRLVAGRSRRDLAEVLARPPVWTQVEEALPDGAPRPWEEPAEVPPVTVPPDVGRLEQQVAHLRQRERALVEKVGELRADVEVLQRERDGAVARAKRAATAEQVALDERDRARAEAEAAHAAAAAADERIAQEVARTRRRDDGELARLRAELTATRREHDRVQRELVAERARTSPLSQPAAMPTPDPSADDGTGGRRGRPSRLPEGIAAGTRRAAEWLVSDGPVLLVDGYNVTRRHRAELSFVDQRRWLEAAVTTLAQRRHVDATIVWDAAHGRATTRRSRAGVTVRFTPGGVTADDELVLYVQLAVDPETPVVAVTDDGELRGRLAQHGVDLLDSQSFVWLL